MTVLIWSPPRTGPSPSTTTAPASSTTWPSTGPEPAPSGSSRTPQDTSPSSPPVRCDDVFDRVAPADRAFAFDYDGTGKLDHLALYRPGTGTIWILKNDGGTFIPVYAQGDPG